MAATDEPAAFSFPALYEQQPSGDDKPTGAIHTSSSEQSLLNGSYSTFDDTSTGSAASSPNGAHRKTRLPNLSAPSDSSAHDISIPFRAYHSYHFSTWAGTFHCRPELFIKPQSVHEVQKVVRLGRKCRRRLVTVGIGHSPNSLTCTSSWMLNLEDMEAILEVEKYNGQPAAFDADPSQGFGLFTNQQTPPQLSRYQGRALVQAGISLEKLNRELRELGLTLPNLGSINVQSLAGAFATGTHGSSLQHGLLSECVRGLRIVLGDGQAVWCSPQHNEDLFRAALVNLGGLGVVTELEIELTPITNIEWEQSVVKLDDILSNWNGDLWTQAEWVRCWLMPYTKKVVVWKADKTNKPLRKPDSSIYNGPLGFYVYHTLLTLGSFFPRILPTVEWFVTGMEYGFKSGRVKTGVEEQKDGLVMNCLFSQFVNEWALPLDKGPEAISRLSKWIHGDEEGSKIPFSSNNVWVHAPIEVRVTNGSKSSNPTRGFLDPSCSDGMTLYLNAILYRPYGLDSPSRKRYFEAFEWLMKELGGRPHWAKNFETITKNELEKTYGDDMKQWRSVRQKADPEGMFVGDWHRRLVLGDEQPQLSLEEVEFRRSKLWRTGVQCEGEQAMAGTEDDSEGSEILQRLLQDARRA